MSNTGKFKVGDWVVRTKYIADFPYGVEPLVVTRVWPWYGRNLLTIRQSNQSWLEEDFEIYVEPENKVPDNMEIVGYQAKVKVAGDWWNINEDYYQAYLEQKDSPFITRIVYAFKQD